MPAPPRTRRGAGDLAEYHAEAVRAGEARALSYVRQGQVAVCEQFLGPGDALAADLVERTMSKCGAEQPLEGAPRQPGGARQRSDVERPVEVGAEMRESGGEVRILAAGRIRTGARHHPGGRYEPEPLATVQRQSHGGDGEAGEVEAQPRQPRGARWRQASVLDPEQQRVAWHGQSCTGEAGERLALGDGTIGEYAEATDGRSVEAGAGATERAGSDGEPTSAQAFGGGSGIAQIAGAEGGEVACRSGAQSQIIDRHHPGTGAQVPAAPGQPPEGDGWAVVGDGPGRQPPSHQRLELAGEGVVLGESQGHVGLAQNDGHDGAMVGYRWPARKPILGA